MALRAARCFPIFLLLLFAFTGTAQAAEARRIVTTENSDYFGFDLRSEQNFTLDQCETSCLGDPSCRAFTYNRKAKWCFLKSDYNQLKPFNGAVAGKVAKIDGPRVGFGPFVALVDLRNLEAPGCRGLPALVASGICPHAFGEVRVRRIVDHLVLGS